MRLSAYNLWLSRSATEEAAYAWLKNGIIIRRNGKGTEEVQIPCDDERMTGLIEHANRVCPEVVPYVTPIYITPVSSAVGEPNRSALVETSR
jgi:hypothetical protein